MKNDMFPTGVQNNQTGIRAVTKQKKKAFIRNYAALTQIFLHIIDCLIISTKGQYCCQWLA